MLNGHSFTTNTAVSETSRKQCNRQSKQQCFKIHLLLRKAILGNKRLVLSVGSLIRLKASLEFKKAFSGQR
jgi:hypothetical protein